MPERLSNSYSHHLQPIIVLYEPSTLSHPLTIAMLFNYALASLALTSCAYATPLKTIVTRQAVVTADALATANAALTPPMPPNVASSGPATPVVDMEKLMADIGNDPALGSLSAADRSDWRDVLKISAPGKICLADIVDHFLGGLPFQLGGCNGNSVGTMCSDDSQVHLVMHIILGWTLTLSTDSTRALEPYLQENKPTRVAVWWPRRRCAHPWYRRGFLRPDLWSATRGTSNGSRQRCGS